LRPSGPSEEQGRAWWSYGDEQMIPSPFVGDGGIQVHGHLPVADRNGRIC
jgi:hypothetical protein